MPHFKFEFFEMFHPSAFRQPSLFGSHYTLKAIQFVLRRIPNYFWSNAMIFMTENISDRFNFRPRDIGMTFAQLVGQMAHGFRNNLDGPFCR